MTRSKAVKRARKLSAFATLGKGHEAEAARMRARELQTKFNLTDAEIAPKESACIVIDEAPGHWRELLAFAVAFSRGCSAKRPGTWIAISGEKKASDDAESLYSTLSKEAEQKCVPTISGPLIEANPHIRVMIDKIWRERFCDGFAMAVAQRLVSKPPEKDPEPTPAATVSPGQEIHEERANKAGNAVIEQGLELAEALARLMDPQRAMAMAHQIYETSLMQGTQTGMATKCPLWSPPPDYTRKCLPPMRCDSLHT